MEVLRGEQDDLVADAGIDIIIDIELKKVPHSVGARDILFQIMISCYARRFSRRSRIAAMKSAEFFT